MTIHTCGRSTAQESDVISQLTGAVPSPRQVLGIVAAAGIITLVACLTLPGLFAPQIAQIRWLHTSMVTVCALIVQALPFVVAGGLVSAAVGVWMTPARWARILPSNPLGATIMGIAAGVLIPTCECASVPLAKRMMDQGVSRAAAVGFMVAAPSLNPLVLATTAIAFGGWRAAAMRATAGLVAVIVVCLTVSIGSPTTPTTPVSDHSHHDHSDHDHDGQAHRWSRWVATAREDIVLAAGFLSVGAMLAAVAQQLLPPEVFLFASDHVVLGVLIAVIAAVVLSLCSMGDAFVAAALPLSPVATMTFLAVGPIIDMKLAGLMTVVLGDTLTSRITVGGIIGGVAGGLLAVAAFTGGAL